MFLAFPCVDFLKAGTLREVEANDDFLLFAMRRGVIKLLKAAVTLVEASRQRLAGLVALDLPQNRRKPYYLWM